VNKLDGGHRYFLINKPHGMLSQFVGTEKRRMLGTLDFDFPEGTHAIGRLDAHSEGLLLLTTDKRITRLLFMSGTPHRRTYLVMVKNAMNAEALLQLQTGVSIRIHEGAEYITPACEVAIVEKPVGLFTNGFEHLEQWPHTWLQITLTEGKYHQVRKMVAAVRHRCLRLIRLSIEDMELGDIMPGEVRELDAATFFQKLKL